MQESTTSRRTRAIKPVATALGLAAATALPLLLRGTGPSAADAAIDAKARDGELASEDRVAITDLVTEYAWLLDHGRFDEVPPLFTDQAVLGVRGQTFGGARGFGEWVGYRERRNGRKTNHQITNVRLERVDPDRVIGTATLVLYAAKTGSRGTYVDLVGEYRDEYVRTFDGWRFHSRQLVELSDS
jgi:3-phenylpropionate/cinnamic acid dioxygenase small subunit